jgi:hypothetical protein
MADNSAQAEIRGINIDKLAKGFADEENVFKKFVTVSKTSAREIRWYKKTAGFLDSTDTSAITGSQIANTAFKSLPVVVEQSWTRQTSYIRKYFVESPLLSDEDIKDSDIDILATNVRDLTRAVARQVDKRIYDVITESLSPSDINTAAAVGNGWDDSTNGNPVTDILVGKQNIRSNGYNPEGCVLAINSIEHKNLLVWLISTKGSSIPNFSSEKVKTGVVMEILGCNVLVSENATTDYAAMWVPSRSATWKSFMPITAATVKDIGIGVKIRIWEEGECLLTDPKSVHLITDTVS